MKIADIYSNNRGRKKVKFFELGVYSILKNELNFRYAKINGKGYYLQSKNGIYEESSVYKIQDALTHYIKNNFEELEVNGEIEYFEFLEAYHKATLIKKNSDYLRTYLSKDFELPTLDLHLLKMELDINYRFAFQAEEMKSFILSEKFIETEERFSGFFANNHIVYYKQTAENTFLILSYPEWNSPGHQPTYDLFKVNAKNKKQLFKSTDQDIKTVMLGFDLSRHKELYLTEARLTVLND